MMFVKTVIRQGEKIIDLEKARKKLENNNKRLQQNNNLLARQNCNLIGMLDDAQEEFLYILDNIEELLTNNNYGRPDISKRKALEYIRQEKSIIEKDLEISNKNELSNDYQSNR